MNAMDGRTYSDWSDTPIFVIPIGYKAYRFYPLDIELITAFLENERERKYCGAI